MFNSEKRLNNLIKKYIFNIPHFLLGSGTAFTVDLLTYTLLSPVIGINLSAAISFVIGTIVLYLVFSITTQPRIKKKRYGLSSQIIVGIGTLSINIVVLNFLQLIYFSLSTSLKSYLLISSPYNYALVSKIIASSCGFFWTSSMTMKFLFKFRSIDKNEGK